MIIFVIDLFRLLYWSFFQPSRLANHVHSLHPHLTVYRGLSQYLSLARQHPPIRYFVLLHLTWWVILGFISGFLYIRGIDTANFYLSNPNVFAQEFGSVFLITIVINLAINTAFGLTFTVPFTTNFIIVIFLFPWSFSLQVQVPIAPSSVEQIIIGLIVVIVFGTIGAIWDAMRGTNRRGFTKNYFIRSLLGIIITIGIILMILIILSGSKAKSSMGRSISSNSWNRIGWALLDGLLLGGIILIAVYINAYVYKFQPLVISFDMMVAALLYIDFIDAIVGIFFITIIGGIAIRGGNGLSVIGILTLLLWFYYIDNRPIYFYRMEHILNWAFPLGLFLTGTCLYVRLPFYLLELPWQAWVYWQAKQQPRRALRWLKRSPVYYDELIFFPLFGLDHLLFQVMKHDREAGLHEATILAQSFRQSWAAEWARLYLTVDILSHYQTRQDITQAAQELSWLTNNLPSSLDHHVLQITQTLSMLSQNLDQLSQTESLNQLETLQQNITHWGHQTQQQWLPVLTCWQNLMLAESSGQQKAALD